MDSTNTPKQITVAEAAKLKGVARATVYNAIRDGRIAHQLIAGHIVLERKVVLTWQPIGRVGRPKGIPVSKEVKKRISISRKRRWQLQKSEQKVSRDMKEK